MNWFFLECVRLDLHLAYHYPHERKQQQHEIETAKNEPLYNNNIIN